MTIWKWLNQKRLQDYPRLVFIACCSVLLLNILFHDGWIGGLTKHLIGGDFITYYAAGKLYLNDIDHLYDIKVQDIAQRTLIAPTNPDSLSFYSYPPNAAVFHAAFTFLPLPLALILWWMLSVVFVVLTAKLIKRYIIPDGHPLQSLSTFQTTIVCLSSFAFIEGFETGQSHALTLILITAVLIATKREHWLLAGFFAALSTYKPQFVLGFLILWLVWRKYKAILSFVAFTLIGNGIVLLTKGIEPYLQFLKVSDHMIYIPYSDAGFPESIMATPFAFIATMLPFSLASTWNQIFVLLGITLVILFAVLVYITSKRHLADQNLILALSILLPLLAFPYALLHDLLILIPVLFLLAAQQEYLTDIKSLAVGVYAAMLFLPLLGYVANIALAALIPIAVFIVCVPQIVRLLKTQNPKTKTPIPGGL